MKSLYNVTKLLYFQLTLRYTPRLIHPILESRMISRCQYSVTVTPFPPPRALCVHFHYFPAILCYRLGRDSIINHTLSHLIVNSVSHSTTTRTINRTLNQPIVTSITYSTTTNTINRNLTSH